MCNSNSFQYRYPTYFRKCRTRRRDVESKAETESDQTLRIQNEIVHCAKPVLIHLLKSTYPQY